MCPTLVYFCCCCCWFVCFAVRSIAESPSFKLSLAWLEYCTQLAEWDIFIFFGMPRGYFWTLSWRLALSCWSTIPFSTPSIWPKEMNEYQACCLATVWLRWLGAECWVTALSHELEMKVRKEQVIRTVGSVWITRHMGARMMFPQFTVRFIYLFIGCLVRIQARDWCPILLNTSANTILPRSVYLFPRVRESVTLRAAVMMMMMMMIPVINRYLRRHLNPSYMFPFCFIRSLVVGVIFRPVSFFRVSALDSGGVLLLPPWVCANRKLSWPSDVEGSDKRPAKSLAIGQGLSWGRNRVSEFPGWGWGEGGGVQRALERRAAARRTADITPWDILKGAESLRIQLAVATHGSARSGARLPPR